MATTDHPGDTCELVDSPIGKAAQGESTVQSSQEESSSTDVHPSCPSPFLTGWRLTLVVAGILLCLFLANLEITIVSTSLLSITDDLKGFNETSWIVTGYLLSYTAFIIVWAKLSDIFGRKPTFITTVFIFVVFSAGCGASRTINQLIIFRTFQGVGAAGIYSMSVLTCYEIVPKSKFAIYGAMVSVDVALATLMGPLLGGLINDNATWRWIFYLNVPAGVVALALLSLAIPAQFPHHTEASGNTKVGRAFNLANLSRLDGIGASLLLCGSFLLVTALLEASIRFSWSSAVTVALLVVSVLSWVAFFIWEYLVSNGNRKAEPVFPWRFVKDRIWMAMLVTSFLMGVPFNAAVISLPQRFQAVTGTTALGAGIRLLPYSLTASIGSLVANIAGAKGKVPFIYLLFLGTLLQVLGLSLLSTLSTTGPFHVKGYGFETLAGAGVGITFGTLILATPYVVQARDLAVATGATLQFRFLGGAVGLAIVSSVMNSYLKSKLKNAIPQKDLEALLQTTSVLTTFDPGSLHLVREVFAAGYNIQFRIMIGFAAAQFLAGALMWKGRAQVKAIEKGASI